MKSYTDIEQSKKLAKILPIESADTLHCIDFDGDFLCTVPKQYSASFRYQPELTIPCWSLAALLEVLLCPSLCITSGEWRCQCYKEDHIIATSYADNPVDACYEMIIKLNEQKLL